MRYVLAAYHMFLGGLIGLVLGMWLQKKYMGG